MHGQSCPASTAVQPLSRACLLEPWTPHERRPEHPPPSQRARPDLCAGNGRARRAQARIDRRWRERPDIPAVVGGREIRSGETPRTSSHPIAIRGFWPRFTKPTQGTIDAAVASAVEAQRDWGHWRFEDRAAVFLRAADLLPTPHRQRLNAATMLGQSKTAFQAEIDSACELIDFLRFNVALRRADLRRSSRESAPGTWNRMDHRPLEGFVYAITPFNFTAIGGNLPTAPALMGNTVVWKPAAHGRRSATGTSIKLLRGGGAAARRHQLRAGRRGRGEPHPARRSRVRRHPLHRVHDGVPDAVEDRSATTSTAIATYPRIVGETGGKDFILAHPSADVDALAVRWCAGRTSTRDRSAARPRARTSPTPCGPRCATGWWR